MGATVVYVHGAFISDVEWWWRPVGDLLEQRGIASRPVDLPSTGDVAPLGDLYADAEATRQAIDACDGPVILVGHSYGGAVITEAAAGKQDKVAHLVYISAVVPDLVAVAQSDYISEEQRANPGAHLEMHDDGTVSEGAQQYKSRVLQSLPTTEMTDAATSRLTRQSLASFMQPTQGAAWKDIPSTYILCQYDADVPVPQQRIQAARTGNVVEVPTNHFAHLERPELVADVILGVAERLGSEQDSELAR